MSFRDEELLIFDGACGANLAVQNIPDAAYEGLLGCNEILNASYPQAVVSLHRSFYDAGAMVVETNTFGANRIVLEEYGLQGRVEELNAAAVENARTAGGGAAGRYVAGSVGPTTKLPSLGHVSVKELRFAYEEQLTALVDAGVDALIIETCQDLLQAKVAVVTALEVSARRGAEVPIMLSVTVETTGTMLVGTELAAVVAAFEPLGLFSLGLNCAVGPELMASHLRRLSRTWPGRISVIPNAGLPEVRGGRTCYPLSPEDFAETLKGYVLQEGVSIVGGCCGTRPDHIRALAEALAKARPASRTPNFSPALASLYDAVEIAQEPRPLLIGERMNLHGSRVFKKALLAGDYEAAARVGVEQERSGAHVLDLSVTHADRDESADIEAMIRLLSTKARSPLSIDTTRRRTVEDALALIAGRPLINSINLEDGGRTAHEVLALAKKHGAAVVGLTIDESGMAMTAARKLEVARRLRDMAVEEHGLRPSDLFVDALTFTLGSGDPKLADSAHETIEGIRLIKERVPGVFTSLGVSNVSFGLPKTARKYLNSVFLHRAVEAGLDAAIVDAGKVLPLAKLSSEDTRVCEALLNNERIGALGPLEAFLEHFGTGGGKENEQTVGRTTPESALEKLLLEGDKDGLEDAVEALRGRYSPTEIISGILIPAMRRIGEMFGRGQMLLPFVLQSAEVMKAAVGLLEPYMDKDSRGRSTRVLLATVRGDVHDIGKNLVDIILSNNGYEVLNAGTNMPAEAIVEQARQFEADIIGLSGLLVKSALEMSSSMEIYSRSGLDVPIMLGGAALTPRFVADDCAPKHSRPVVYCADAFAGLRAVQDLEAGRLESTVWLDTEKEHAPGARIVSVQRDAKVPKAPFYGPRYEQNIDLEALFEHVNEQVLFRGRWGFRRGKLSEGEYDELIGRQARPAYDALRKRALKEGFLQPRAAYGYFPCHSQGDDLVVESGHKEHRFSFPRQPFPPHLCISDFFKSEDERGDLVGFFAVTLGEKVSQETQRLFASDAYKDYLLLHGLAVELTEALAEHWHEVMRRQLGLEGADPPKRYRGARYGFGYPACPDLEAQKPLFALLRPEKIGLSLTEGMEMIPEMSTSALVAHHPQAKYFAV